MPTDRLAWRPPSPEACEDLERLPGALHGTLLFEQDRHRAVKDGILAFLAKPCPAVVEVGVDHAMRILDQARRHPSWRWLGVEIRRRRVQAASPHAPDNARLIAMDGRTLLSAIVPPGRLDAIVLWFPTPTDNPKHLLLTPSFVALAERALAPHGVVHFATDVPAMADWFDSLFAGWLPGSPPPAPAVLSRRERVSLRDGVAIDERCVRRPE